MIKILRSLIKKTNSVVTETSTEQLSVGWHEPLSADKLLSSPLRQQYLKTIWQNVSMEPQMFNVLYKAPIEKFAEIVQHLPASESHHHSHVGGMLDHGLEVISIAAKLRQSYVLPQNSAPEEQAKQRDVWTAVVIYAALLHDIGKIAVDIEIVLQNGTRWFPWQGKPEQPYNFRYIKNRDYSLHPVLGCFFANNLIPKEAFDWIAPFPQAFSSLMYFISGHPDKSGILSEIIQRADQISVTMALGGDPSKLSEKPKLSFAKQLHIALRNVVEKFKLNAPKGGCDGWLTEDALWLMSKSTADNIRSYLMLQGVPVPAQNGKIFDELQAHGLIQKTSSDTAIWNGKVISNVGWAPPKPFTLLKISPEIIWENLDDRPEIFDGRIDIVNDNGGITTTTYLPPKPAETLETETLKRFAEKSEQEQLTTEKNTIQSERMLKDEGPQKSNESMEIDYVLNMFSPMTETVSQDSGIEEINLNDPVKTSLGNVLQPTESEQKHLGNISQQAKDNLAVDNSSLIDARKFISWVKAGVISGKLVINRPNAKLHIVEKHLFLVTPSIFQLYLKEVANSTDKESWELLQKQFQNLGIHKRQHTDDDSRNIWTCSIVGPNKQSLLNGYLIEDMKLFIGDKILLNNQWLKLQGDLQ
ncbi:MULTISPECIES: MobH family relaxase [Glaesserella]|uniref:Relaxase n=1 Tax=Glaesserella australis TaxID=2094024 RepID=A0A328BUM7_9PAST|nr:MULTISPECIES: MobH family relaxase [Glaesserella]AUI65846.1 relaxase [Glaesserella sp. 15-184]RAL18008.1 relaxase [Glaesserella australis]